MGAKICRILIVEDDLSLKPFWGAVLNKLSKKTQVSWAVSSEEAERNVLEKQNEGVDFDLIITDLFLAGSNTGIDLLRSSAVKNSRSKTILVSLAEQKSLIAECKKSLPKTKVIVKPLNVHECETAVQKCLKLGTL